MYLRADLLSLNDELPDDLLWGGDSSGATNGLSNGSLDGLGVSSNASSSMSSQPQQPGPGMMTQSNMGGIRQPGPGMAMNQMGSMANPNQNTTLVNALAGKVPGQMANVRLATPSSTPNNSISDGSMTSMGGPMNQQGNTELLSSAFSHICISCSCVLNVSGRTWPTKHDGRSDETSNEYG